MAVHRSSSSFATITSMSGTFTNLTVLDTFDFGDVTMDTATFDGQVILDGSLAEMFLVRQDGDSGDVFNIDSSNNEINIPSGRLGIGVSGTPSTMLEVVGQDSNNKGAIFKTSDGDNHSIAVQAGAGANSFIELQNDTDDTGWHVINGQSLSPASFAIFDEGNNTIPFKIEEGAPTDTIYVGSGGSVGIKTTPDSNVSLDVDGEWQYEVSDHNQNGMLFGVSSADLPTIGPIIAGSEVSSSQIRYNNNTTRWEFEAAMRALAGLVVDDDQDLAFGTGSPFEMRFDPTNNQFEFENSNNNNILTVQNGSQDVEFLGSVGIGVAPPASADLHLEKDNPRFRLLDTNGKASDIFQSGSNLILQTVTTNGNCVVQNNSLTSVLNLDMDNEVGYFPQGKLIVDDTGTADETSNGAILTNDNTDNSATAVNSYDGGIQISNSSQVDGSYSLFKFNHGASPDADGAYIKSSRVDNNQTTMELGQYDNGGNVAGTPYISMDENYNVDIPNGDLSVGAGQKIIATASGDGDKFLSLNSSNNSELAFYQDPTGGGDFSIERDNTRYIRFASDITYYDQPLVVDQSNTDSLLVRKNGNTGDIFRADTSNVEVTIGSSSQKANFAIHGGLQYERNATGASDYTTSGGQDTIIIGVDDLSSARTVTIASSDISNEGQVFIISDEAGNAGTNNITVATEGAETIDGATDLTIDVDYDSAVVYSDGTNLFTT